MRAEAGVGACSTYSCQHCRVLHPVLCDPTSYQLRKHLPRLLHGKQLRAGDMLRCTRVCTTLLLQVWRTEVEHRFPKSVTVRTPKSPSKGMSATKSARHSMLRQIYGKYSGYSATNTSGSRVSHQSAIRLIWTTLHPNLKKKKVLFSITRIFTSQFNALLPARAPPLSSQTKSLTTQTSQLSAGALLSHQPTWPSDPVSLWPF